MRRRAKWYLIYGNRKVSNTKHQRLVSSHDKIEDVPVSVHHLLPSSVLPFYLVLGPIHTPSSLESHYTHPLYLIYNGVRLQTRLVPSLFMSFRVTDERRLALDGYVYLC
jgi:hypothetical protein